MKKVNAFKLSFPNVVLRFYFMMAIVIATGFLGSVYLAAVLGFLFSVSSILGISLSTKSKKESKKTGVFISLNPNKKVLKIS